MSSVSRLWATISYREHWDSNGLLAWLRDKHLEGFVSPLHDDEGKKPHWHIMLLFDGNKSEKSLSFIRDCECFAGLERVDNKVGYLRYLCHLDESEKKHYSPSDVTPFGRYTLLDFNDFIKTSRPKVLSNVDCVDKLNEILTTYPDLSFRGLVEYITKYDPALIDFVIKRSYFVNALIRG